MNENVFKSYDVRGEYPQEINEKIVFEIALGLGRYFNRLKRKKSKIVVARDGRLGSFLLYKAAIKGLKGKKIIKAGLTTTPMFYFLVAKLKADGGIMITASHGPKEYNGLKAVRRNAVMVNGKEILKIVKQELGIKNNGQ